MLETNNCSDDLEEEQLAAEVKAVVEWIYRRHLPPYLKESWSKGKGKWYEDWLREQLDILVISELCDDPGRLAELERRRNEVALLFGIFGAAFRLLDHMGMHLRGQTLGQYEVMPEDWRLLRRLCRRFLDMNRFALSPLDILLPEEYQDLL